MHLWTRTHSNSMCSSCFFFFFSSFLFLFSFLMSILCDLFIIFQMYAYAFLYLGFFFSPKDISKIIARAQLHLIACFFFFIFVKEWSGYNRYWLSFIAQFNWSKCRLFNYNYRHIYECDCEWDFDYVSVLCEQFLFYPFRLFDDFSNWNEKKKMFFQTHSFQLILIEQNVHQLKWLDGKEKRMTNTIIKLANFLYF